MLKQVIKLVMVAEQTKTLSGTEESVHKFQI